MFFLEMFFLSLDFDQSGKADRLIRFSEETSVFWFSTWLKAEGRMENSDMRLGDLVIFCESSEA